MGHIHIEIGINWEKIHLKFDVSTYLYARSVQGLLTEEIEEIVWGKGMTFKPPEFPKRLFLFSLRIRDFPDRSFLRCEIS